MLRELHITNLAVIEDATVELAAGLNCFTGQTGAGKSLLIGAFELMLGLRSATDLLRHGAEEGRVNGLFELRDPNVIQQANTIADLSLDEKGGPAQVLITRKLFASGRTSVSINGQPATLQMLSRLGSLLVDVHGQHDHQLLLQPAAQLTTLDGFAETVDLRKQFADKYQQLRQLQQRRKELDASQTLRDQQLELYRFQADEIDAAEPMEGEDIQIEARHRLLANLEKIGRDAAAATSALYESDGAVVENLQAILGIVRELTELDEAIKPVAELLHGAAAQLQDAAFDLARYQNRLDLDPAELAEVTDRLNTLNRLIHKYGSQGPGPGGRADDVIAYRRQIQTEIDRLQGESADLTAMDQRIEPLQRELDEIGQQLSRRRRAAAERLQPLIEAELAELGMGEAQFEISFEDAPAGSTGCDALEMLVRANPGQPARPLRRVASGGELSRVMLAIKSIVADADRISVLVFDEIDANVGGRLGTVLGRKLQGLAGGHQVLCITHLPQIAAFADHHLHISKSVEGKTTRTRVRSLGERKQRIDELAEMLTGKHATATTRAQADEMLNMATEAIASPTAKIKRTRRRNKPNNRTTTKRTKKVATT
ncbi:MAG: DNA repair protein RecN [Phycisphaeraceae bacterium]